MNIHGKEYITVNERVQEFRRMHPLWTIFTRIVSHADGMIVMATDIFDDAGRTIANGHAYEVKGSSNVNKTSYIENCETSAVGRALGMLGIGIIDSIASAEEVKGAIEQQRSTAPDEFKTMWGKLTPEDKKYIKAQISSGFNEMTPDEQENILVTMRTIIAKAARSKVFGN